MDEEFVRNQLADMCCGQCGQKLTPANMDLLEHKGDSWSFSAYCQSCQSQGIVTAFLKNREVPEADAELTKAEIGKFSAPICWDDVLDMYTFLKDFGGDFSGLFADEQPVS